MKLSEHFELDEFIRSQTAYMLGIDNLPPEEVKANLGNLCEKLLQPLRVAIGMPIVISSGYRCGALNKAVGGSTTSQHMKGEAADCVTDGKAADLLRLLLELKLDFDQAILYPSQNFLHLSLKSEGVNRKQVIRYK